MTITSRPYRPNTDRWMVLDLLTAARAAEQYCRYLTGFRLDLLLASRLWEPGRDAHVWLDARGKLVGFAMLWRRGRERHEVTLEYFADPNAGLEDFDAQVLGWARTRSAGLARELQQAAMLTVVAGETEHARAAFLRRHAFTPIEDYPVRMGCALAENLPPAPLPQGFALRRLDAGTDLDAYSALYEQVFSSVSADHRRELLRNPDYAHFVVSAPDGALVAFCECSVSRAEWALGGHRDGEIDYLGTQEDFQRQGLGSALVHAAFGQLRAWGAEGASLVTGGTNERAQHVYRRAGMAITDRARLYALEIAS